MRCLMNTSKEPKLNVLTNQILAHIFSQSTLDFVVTRAIHTLVCTLYLVHSLYGFVLATTVSSLVDEGTVQSIKLQHGWKEQLSKFMFSG